MTKRSLVLLICISAGSIIVNFIPMARKQMALKNVLISKHEFNAPANDTLDSGPGNMSVAIIVPYRNRSEQLIIFTTYMDNFLRRQNSTARLYIIEQADKNLFNRAKLFNVGYMEAKKDGAFTCYIFHDVDLLPLDPRLPYTCSSEAVHMSVAIDKFKYRLPYKALFGGVSALTDSLMQRINGFPNRYWGWGGEDDDIHGRITAVHAKITRPSPSIARYSMLSGRHVSAPVNKKRSVDFLLNTPTYSSNGPNDTNLDLVREIIKIYIP